MSLSRRYLPKNSDLKVFRKLSSEILEILLWFIIPVSFLYLFYFWFLTQEESKDAGYWTGTYRISRTKLNSNKQYPYHHRCVKLYKLHRDNSRNHVDLWPLIVLYCSCFLGLSRNASCTLTGKMYSFNNTSKCPSETCVREKKVQISK